MVLLSDRAHRQEAWVAKQETDEVDQLCRVLQDSDDVIRRWYDIFCQAVLHVKLSIHVESQLEVQHSESP